MVPGHALKAYTVSELTELIKRTLEMQVGEVALEGEISNLRTSGAGHIYFTLKDESAMISAVMFRGRAARLAFEPEDGMLVRVRGNISVYAKRGNYQIIVEGMEIAGEGRILALLEERKRRLAAEGLFDPERKRPLPMLPQRIAVVTSPTGAAIRDMLQVLGRRNAGLHLVILPTAVQGDTAAEQIAAQIRRADLHKLGEVVVVTRGGGSLEDLLPFSEEPVVRAVADCSVPVISAVGHEVDTALCDYAADYRAPTPSAAAETVTAPREELYRRVMSLGREIAHGFTRRLEHARDLVARFHTENLQREFRILIQPYQLRLDDAKEEITREMRDRVRHAGHRLELARRRLEAVSPLEILQRGFSVVQSERSGAVITRAEDLEAEELFRVRFAQGAVRARTEEHLSDEEL